MRNNQPVTQRAFELPDDATLMSTTDADSHIAYANEAFVAASGFSREELQGQPHSIVRHPDMPRQAFADMWATVQGGEPWTGLVKNRRENGDHYWVRANVVPVVRAGRITGHLSIRTKPAVEEVAQAQQLYRELREDRAGSRALHKGILVRTGWQRWRSWPRTLSLRWRVHGVLGLLWPLMGTAAALSGATGAALAGFALGSAAALLAAAALLEREVVRPVQSLRRAALDVATGAAHEVQRLERVDEIGMTLRSIGQIGLMFRWLVDDVSQQATGVQRAAAEITQGTGDLSSRTEQSAASLEQTASSMEQMTASVSTSAQAASQADTLARQAREAAVQGELSATQAMATMEGIAQGSRRIRDITGLIDGIAFQTNILALNAAVEAARAGEQGRGFAVVAGEVRSLAQRSAEAAKEIRRLIEESVGSVEAGSETVCRAGRSMQAIVAQIGRVSDLIGELSSAAAEQSTGIGQVNQAVGHMDQVTQQNAALVEQSAAAAQALQLRAQWLTSAMGVFR